MIAAEIATSGIPMLRPQNQRLSRYERGIRNAEIVRMISAGEGTLRSVAILFGISFQGVQVICKMAGVVPRGKQLRAERLRMANSVVAEKIKTEVVGSYRQHRPMRLIAKEMGVSHNVVRIALESVRQPWQKSQRGMLGENSRKAIVLFKAGFRVQEVACELGISPAHAYMIRRRHLPEMEKADRQARRGMAYPFVFEETKENQMLLAVNKLVPNDIGDRDDICQDILLSLLEGEVQLEDLQAQRGGFRKFLTSFRKNNLEGRGFARSLDVPRADGRSWYDVLPAELPAEDEDDEMDKV